MEQSMKSMQEILINLFETVNELDILYKKAFGEILTNYTFTQMHVIDCIGKIENPNVTKIAQYMKLTKPAIVKCIKKLISMDAIEIYKNPANKKEIYYKLTDIGKEVYNKHLTLHEIWCSKDDSFFNRFSKNETDITFKILTKYEKLLQERIKNIKGEINEKNL